MNITIRAFLVMVISQIIGMAQAQNKSVASYSEYNDTLAQNIIHNLLKKMNSHISDTMHLTRINH